MPDKSTPVAMHFMSTSKYWFARRGDQSLRWSRLQQIGAREMVTSSPIGIRHKYSLKVFILLISMSEEGDISAKLFHSQ